MRRAIMVITFLASVAASLAAQSASVAAPATAPPAPTWREKVAEAMPLLGHRNMILVVDSAYPLQSAPGIETIETNASSWRCSTMFWR